MSSGNMENVVQDAVTEGRTVSNPCDAARSMFPCDLTWLLHRASHLLGEAVEAETLQRGVGIRGHLLLTALLTVPGRTQLALGAALGLDKTTVTTALDKLERQGLIVRRSDPADRRARIPEITNAGREMQARIDPMIRDLEMRMLDRLTHDERAALREILVKVIDSATHDLPRAGGSCI